LLPIVSIVFGSDSWRLNAGAHGKRQILSDAHLSLSGNDDAGNDTESNLRNYEPGPINLLVKHWVHGFKHAVQQTRP
jgi:hypothetical protein